MNNQTHRLGFDRFMALSWVNMALELRLLNQDTDHAFRQLKEWLSKEIPGKVTARKTTNQIRKVWLAHQDLYDELRLQAIDDGLVEDVGYRTLLHHGLCINIFPLFWDVCQITGRLLNLQDVCQRSDIHQRVLERYGNPISTKLAVNRTIQTLIDWGLLVEQSGKLSNQIITVDNVNLIQWLIAALLSARATDKLPLADLSNAPELLGIHFQDPRSAIRMASFLYIERGLDIEMVHKG